MSKLKCTGDIDRTVGKIIHDGASCLIHEPIAGMRTEVKEESDLPILYVTLEFLQERENEGMRLMY